MANNPGNGHARRWQLHREIRQHGFQRRIRNPISLGDSYNGHRVVATTGAMFEHFRYGRGQPLAVQRGQWFNDLFEVVLGAAGIATVSPWLQANYGVLLTLRPLNQVEWVLLAAVPVSALVIGLVPALSAWRRGRRPGWHVLDDA